MESIPMSGVLAVPDPLKIEQVSLAMDDEDDCSKILKRAFKSIMLTP